MAAFVAFLEAYSLGKEVYKIYNDARDLLKKVCRNPTVAARLAEIYKRLSEELSPLAEKCENNTMRLPEVDLKVFTARIEQLKTNLRETRDSLQKKISDLENKSLLHRLVGAGSTEDWFSELAIKADQASQLVLDVTSHFITYKKIGQLVSSVEQLSLELRNIRTVIADSKESGMNVDRFRPSFEVPDNPPHVVLNFSPLVEQEGGSSLPHNVETKLKAAVLHSDGSQNIAAVGPDLLRDARFEGNSGVGKSCALRGLGKDIEVQERFPDGVYYILLGKDAKEADVVQQLAQIIKKSGGTKWGRKIQGDSSVTRTVIGAREWFNGKRILLLVDDVWEGAASGRDVVNRLSSTADVSSGSRMVFTTREKKLTEDCKQISFSSRDDDEALAILLKAAGLQKTQVAQCRAEVRDVLQFCGGNPMALAVAGSSIAAQREFAPDSALESIWNGYLSKLRRSREVLLRKRVLHDAHDDLFSTFGTSLSMLERIMPGMGMSEKYRTLVILRTQGFLPVEILERAWSVTREEALEIMNAFVNANLALRVNRVLNGESTLGLTLHDLHLDYVQDQCKQHEETKRWHRQLVKSYIREQRSSNANFPSRNWWRQLARKDTSRGKQSLIKWQDWWMDDVFKEDYIRKNVSRHLVGAGLSSEARTLLKNPRWAATRLRANEIVALEQEFEEVRVLRSGAKEANDDWVLTMIVGAARLSSPYVSRNPREVWFQLYTRLLPLRKQSRAISLYLRDIGRYAERPWLKALSPCLPAPGGPLQSTVLCEGFVTGISQFDKQGNLIVCGINYRDGASCNERAEEFVSKISAGQVEKTTWLGGGASVNASRDDHASGGGGSEASTEKTGADDTVSAVSCKKDGTLVAAGQEDGTVMIWNVESGTAVGSQLRGHKKAVECVAWSPDGKHVASGSSDETVRVWDAQSGEAVCRALCRRSGTVYCVAWSPDGKRLVSGSQCGTVRMWDAKSGEAIGGPLRGHSTSALCVAWSPDGKHIASGSERGTVRVWHAKSGEAVNRALCRGSGTVYCVAWSPDSKRVASGSQDGTVRVWDLKSEEAIVGPLRGHSTSAFCVAWSPDGNRLASGSRDWTVCVWDVASAEGEGFNLQKRAISAEYIAKLVRRLSQSADLIMPMSFDIGAYEVTCASSRVTCKSLDATSSEDKWVLATLDRPYSWERCSKRLLQCTSSEDCSAGTMVENRFLLL